MLQPWHPLPGTTTTRSIRRGAMQCCTPSCKIHGRLTPDEDANELTEAMGETAYELRQLAPDSGAYINEVTKSMFFLDRPSADQHHSVETSCPTGRRLCTARTTLVCSPSSTSTIRMACNGARAVLRARSGTSRMMANSASSVGRRRALLQHRHAMSSQ